MRSQVSVIVPASIFVSFLTLVVFAQDGLERGWNEKLQVARLEAQPPPATEAAKPPVPLPKPKPPEEKQKLLQEGFVGFTLWLHRESVQSDPPVVRGFEHGNDGQRVEWTPVRTDPREPMKLGQRFSISVEGTRSGYLYIVDQEVYQDGSRGTPYLIFPTYRLLKGNNRVTAGRVVMIPAPDDNPPFYNLKAERPGLVAEEFTVIVSSERLEGFMTAEGRQALSKEGFEQVQKNWMSRVQGPLDRKDKAGKLFSLAEKKASIESLLLAPSDPMPQSLFRVEFKPEDPIVVRIPVRVALPD